MPWLAKPRTNDTGLTCLGAVNLIYISDDIRSEVALCPTPVSRRSLCTAAAKPCACHWRSVCLVTVYVCVASEAAFCSNRWQTTSTLGSPNWTALPTSHLWRRGVSSRRCPPPGTCSGELSSRYQRRDRAAQGPAAQCSEPVAASGQTRCFDCRLHDRAVRALVRCRAQPTPSRERRATARVPVGQH